MNPSTTHPSPLTLYRLILVAALLAGTLAISSSPATATDKVDALAHACGATMNFAPGTAEYDDCVNTLQSAQLEARQDAAPQQRSSSCIAKGLKPGTSDYATCMLDNDNPS